MCDEAANAGYYHSPGWNKDFPRIQIVTVLAILAGKKIDYPPTNITFRDAPRAKEIVTKTKLGAVDETKNKVRNRKWSLSKNSLRSERWETAVKNARPVTRSRSPLWEPVRDSHPLGGFAASCKGFFGQAQCPHFTISLGRLVPCLPPELDISV